MLKKELIKENKKLKRVINDLSRRYSKDYQKLSNKIIKLDREILCLKEKPER